MAELKSTLLANQLLAGFQQKDPKIHDLFRAIIKDLNDLTVATEGNTTSIGKILNPPDDGTIGLTHGQVMKRIAGAT